MRGKGVVPHIPAQPAGITPARAGKSNYCPIGCGFFEDHPRACGEKRCQTRKIRPSQGSPPRVRGKARVLLGLLAVEGITPARAGKRAIGFTWNFIPWDHPRACGEKRTFAKHCRAAVGSPPRVRGKVLFGYEQAPSTRITPARAGKRLKRIPYLLRSCAKHLFTLQFCVDDLCQLAVGHSAVSLNIR